MHDHLILRSFFSQAAGRPWDKVTVFREYEPAENMLNQMRIKPDNLYVILSHDYGHAGPHWQLDRLLDHEPRRYKILCTHSDHIVISSTTAGLKNFTLVPWCIFIQSYIDCLLAMKSHIEDKFVIDHSQPLWLSLMRSNRGHRKFLKEKWIEPHAEYFLYTYGRENFVGDYDFYDQGDPPNTAEIANLLNFISLAMLFNETCGSIISETMGIMTISEKTIHGFLGMHPMMIVNHPGTISYLRDNGFDMFDDIIDHSYDSIENWDLRIDRMMTDNWSLIQNGINRATILERLLYNRNHVWTYYDNNNVMAYNMVKEFASTE